MTTTELIVLLQAVEKGASGRSREIKVKIGKEYFSKVTFYIEGTGDGCAGAELLINIKPEEH